VYERCLIGAKTVLRSRLDRNVGVALADLERVFRGYFIDDASIAVEQNFDPRGHNATRRNDPGLGRIIVWRKDSVLGDPRDDPNEAIDDDIRKHPNDDTVCDAKPRHQFLKL
jgi:hypothetical protein